MQKNFQENFGVVEVDEYTRDYYVRIPEWIINEMNWYDGTEINIKVYLYFLNKKLLIKNNWHESCLLKLLLIIRRKNYAENASPYYSHSNYHLYCCASIYLIGK